MRESSKKEGSICVSMVGGDGLVSIGLIICSNLLIRFKRCNLFLPKAMLFGSTFEHSTYIISTKQKAYHKMNIQTSLTIKSNS